ncbi:MAG: hypothetical protein ACRD2W_06015, partial [Acidimicrobiales bacterium]
MLGVLVDDDGLVVIEDDAGGRGDRSSKRLSSCPSTAAGEGLSTACILCEPARRPAPAASPGTSPPTPGRT